MKRLLIISFGLLLFISCKPKQEFSEKPNILFIITDDQSYKALEAWGNQTLKTPNMNRLVEEGVSFTHTYNMGGWNGAICTASRNMLLSGRYLWRANEFRKKWRDKDSTQYQHSWAKLMENQGYNTYMTGKWHVDAGADKLFQVARHIRPGMPRDEGFFPAYRDFQKPENTKTWNEIMPAGYNRPLDGVPDPWSPSDSSWGGFWEGGIHWSEVVRNDAVDYLKDAAVKEAPFFMYLAFNAPHDPRQSPKEYVDMYPAQEMTLPESWMPEYPWKDSIGCSRGLRDEALGPFPRTEAGTKVHIQEYYAIISHLDTQIGLILDALEATGKKDNTYIFFTADHGLSVGEHGLLGKQNMYDHSLRIPFMMVGPGVPANKKIDTPIYLQDAMATSLELAGIEKPGYVEFQSLAGLAMGKTDQKHYEEIYGAYIDHQRMIRKDNFKLVVYPRINKVMLFDLENDPNELNDIAGDAAQTTRVKSLFQSLLKLQQNMEDPLDLRGVYDSIFGQEA